jgi:hypothetical protein
MASTPDQVHACQMMTEVHTVSIVAKNTYAGKTGFRESPLVRGIPRKTLSTAIANPTCDNTAPGTDWGPARNRNQRNWSSTIVQRKTGMRLKGKAISFKSLELWE